MFVLGTAGHIDHGKSVLVRALTGIDPDRLREEKERGMTIDLGFAWLKLPGGQEVGIVDVPGHERFVKNMLAGVGGIDLAMLIVAANEGVMPQTKEHLAILDLLRVPRGVVAITKKDLVDEDMLALVRMEVEELLSGTALEGAPIVPVSALNGDGIPELLASIDSLLKEAEPRRDMGRPRLPVDRVFTMSGSGTVVTGTLIDGSLTVGQEVEIAPKGLKTRLRGLQTHKSKIDTAEPGSRVAANLVGVNTSQLQRGDVITKPGWLKASGMLTGRLRLISYLARPLRHGVTVSLHTGAAETMAKVRLLEADEMKPGDDGWVQLVLESPVAAVKGDRFIIRSPMETLGGGDIVDTRPRRLRRFRPEVLQNLQAREGGTTAEAVLALLEAHPSQTLAALVTQGNLPAEEVAAALEELIEQGLAVAVGEGDSRLLLSASSWERLRADALAALGEYHRRFPARPGMPKVELGSRLKKGGAAAAVTRLVGNQDIIEEGANVRLPSHSVQLTGSQQGKIDAFLAALKKNPYAPPSELIPEPDLLALLVGQGKAVKVAEGVVFSRAAYDEMVAGITGRIRADGKVNVGTVRDMYQTSRKYVLALLEHLDGLKITRRIGDDRVLY